MDSGQGGQSNPHRDHQSGHRVIEVSSAGSPFWRGSAVAYRQPVDQLAQAAIIESQRIRLPTSICRLERASHEGGALKVSGECQDSISYTSQTAYVKLRSKNEIVFNPNGDPALDTSMTRCPL
jgi:hypothetical protein